MRIWAWLAVQVAWFILAGLVLRHCRRLLRDLQDMERRLRSM